MKLLIALALATGLICGSGCGGEDGPTNIDPTSDFPDSWRKLADLLDDNNAPTWSPDGTMVAYTKGAELWKVPALGGEATLVVRNVEFDLYHPEWSPTGGRIAITTTADIMVVPSDGGSMTIVVDWEPGNKRANYPTWSPDGTHLAYILDGEIWTVLVNGGSPTLVATFGGEARNNLSWSPDGDDIVFTTETGIWSVPATGGEVVQVSQRRALSKITWSSDGTWIAFIDYDRERAESHLVARQSISTGEVVFPHINDVVKGKMGIIQCAWSPNGSQFAIVGAQATDRYSLWVVPASE